MNNIQHAHTNTQNIFVFGIDFHVAKVEMILATNGFFFGSSSSPSLLSSPSSFSFYSSQQNDNKSPQFIASSKMAPCRTYQIDCHKNTVIRLLHINIFVFEHLRRTHTHSSFIHNVQTSQQIVDLIQCIHNNIGNNTSYER